MPGAIESVTCTTLSAVAQPFAEAKPEVHLQPPFVRRTVGSLGRASQRGEPGRRTARPSVRVRSTSSRNAKAPSAAIPCARGRIRRRPRQRGGDRAVATGSSDSGYRERAISRVRSSETGKTVRTTAMWVSPRSRRAHRRLQTGCRARAVAPRGRKPPRRSGLRGPTLRRSLMVIPGRRGSAGTSSRANSYKNRHGGTPVSRGLSR